MNTLNIWAEIQESIDFIYFFPELEYQYNMI